MSPILGLALGLLIVVVGAAGLTAFALYMFASTSTMKITKNHFTLRFCGF